MIRFVLAMLVAGFIVSCAVDEAETSGTLVDPNQEVDLPEQLSVENVDHNRDGIIDNKDLSLVANFWGQEVPDNDEAETMNTIELGTKLVGVLFRILRAESVRRLEAHNSNGKVDGALARWQTHTGADIFAVKRADGLFLTETALTEGVTKLIGFDSNDNMVLKANVNIEAREDNITVTSALVTLGNRPDHTLVAFQRTPTSFGLDDDFEMDAHSTNNRYLSLDANMQVYKYYTGFIVSAGTDGRGIWVGIDHSDFRCVVGEKVMALVRRLNIVYTGTCLPDTN